MSKIQNVSLWSAVIWISISLATDAFVGERHATSVSNISVKPVLEGASKSIVSDKEVLSTAFFSTNSFFYDEDERSERYELYLKAAYQIAKGERVSVDDTSQSLLKLAPHSAAYDVRARFLFDTEKFDQLLKLPIFQPDKWHMLSWETLLLGARASEAIGDTQKADELFDYLMKKKSDRDQVVYFDVVRLLKRGSRDKALDRVNDFLKGATLKSKHALFFQLKAAIFMQPPHVDIKKALEMINKSVELNPRSHKGWMTKAALHDRLGQGEEAIDAIRNILDIGDDQFLRKALVERLFRRGKFGAAIVELEKVPEESPEHYFDLALLNWKAGDSKIAEKHIETALVFNKDFRKARLLKLEILVKADKKKALSALEEWLEKSPDDIVPLKALMSMTNHGCSRKEVLSVLDKLYGKNPRSISLLSAVADMSLAVDDDMRAITLYRKLSSLAKDSPALASRAQYQIGYIQYKIDRPADSIKSLGKALKLDDNLDVANNLLAYIYAQEGRMLNKALLLVNKALVANPLSAAFLDTKAFILLRLDRRKEALQVLKKALQIDPLNVTIRNRTSQIKATFLRTAVGK